MERKRLRGVARRREGEEERAFIEAEVNVGGGGKVEEVDTTAQATGRSRDAFGHVITGTPFSLSVSVSLSLSLYLYLYLSFSLSLSLVLVITWVHLSVCLILHPSGFNLC